MPVNLPLRPARPRHRPLGELAALLHLPAPDGAVRVAGVTHDSRAVHPADLYVALAGEHTHGAAFAADAAAAGAVAVLTDPAGRERAAATGLPVLVVDDPRGALGAVAAWAYGDPSAGLLLFGVTGTNGKTTASYLLEAGLRAAGHTTGLVGTVETRIAGDTVPSVRTTPEATDLQALLAVMRERGVTAAAMEVSSHALALGRAGGLRFAAGMFTNLSQDHLDFHHDMEDYFAAKARLFDGRCAAEVVNVDDEYGRRLVRPATVTVSAEGRPDATWRALDVTPVHGEGSTFTAVGRTGAIAVRVGMPGRFNVANALLALAALDAAGVDARDAAGGFVDVAVPGRMERVRAGQDFLAVVDYAHKPGALVAVLSALREVTLGRLICVVGCGGDRDRGKRPVMGATAARGADIVIVTDDNPRSEDPAAIRAEVLTGARGVPGADVREIGDRREAISAALRLATPADTVLVAGKGHESGQEIGGVVHPFDDRAVIRDLLAGALR